MLLWIRTGLYSELVHTDVVQPATATAQTVKSNIVRFYTDSRESTLQRPFSEDFIPFADLGYVPLILASSFQPINGLMHGIYIFFILHMYMFIYINK